MTSFARSRARIAERAISTAFDMAFLLPQLVLTSIGTGRRILEKKLRFL